MTRRVHLVATLGLMGLGLLVLAACASLSEGQCKAGDWRGIGYEDGTKGAQLSRLTDHRKACSEFGIVPDQSEWLAGRDQGLVVYCTPDTAFQEGKRGRSVSPVCTPQQLSAMRQANSFGLRYYELGEEKKRLENERWSIDQRLRSLSGDDDAARAERRQLQRERAHLDGRISQIERDRWRFDTWPG